LADVKAAWEKGDFNSVNSLAQSMTNADLKASANAYVNDVAQYNGYINQARNLQGSNPQEAIRQLGLAQSLNPNGPGNPAGMIAALQKPNQPQAKTPPQAPAVSTPKVPVATAPDKPHQMAQFSDDARSAEKQGNLLEALKDWGLVLNLDPANTDAQNNVTRIGQLIRSNPTESRTELTVAIRDFYHSQFDDALVAFRDYLKSPQNAQHAGAAYFYLGATLVEQSMLSTPQAKWQGPSSEARSAFKDARKANYSPARQYVSPSLLKIWDSILQ
jgi:tetratricopeptide (TPR) repeat protein